MSCPRSNKTWEKRLITWVKLPGTCSPAGNNTKEVKLDKKDGANRQALAAIGTTIFIENYYQKHFGEYGIVSAQILLSADDFDSRKRTNHAKEAIEVMLKNGVIPIVNENDPCSD